MKDFPQNIALQPSEKHPIQIITDRTQSCENLSTEIFSDSAEEEDCDAEASGEDLARQGPRYFYKTEIFSKLNRVKNSRSEIPTLLCHKEIRAPHNRFIMSMERQKKSLWHKRQHYDLNQSDNSISMDLDQ